MWDLMASLDSWRSRLHSRQVSFMFIFPSKLLGNYERFLRQIFGGNGEDRESFRNATKPARHHLRTPAHKRSESFNCVLRFRLSPRLPLHILDRISPAPSERDDVIGHVARTRPSGFSRRRTRVGALEGPPHCSAPRNPPTAIAGRGFAQDRGSGECCLRPALGRF